MGADPMPNYTGRFEHLSDDEKLILFFKENVCLPYKLKKKFKNVKPKRLRRDMQRKVILNWYALL